MRYRLILNSIGKITKKVKTKDCKSAVLYKMYKWTIYSSKSALLCCKGDLWCQRTSAKFYKVQMQPWVGFGVTTMLAVCPTKVVTIEDNLSHSIVFIENDFDTGAHILLFTQGRIFFLLHPKMIVNDFEFWYIWRRVSGFQLIWKNVRTCF